MRISDWSSDVCSSELCKVIGLSVDPVGDHDRWLADIKDATGGEVRYPIIGDHDLNVAKLYGMLPAGEAGTSEGRTAATNQTVRTVFLIGPHNPIKAMLDRKSIVCGKGVSVRVDLGVLPTLTTQKHHKPN